MICKHFIVSSKKLLLVFFRACMLKVWEDCILKCRLKLFLRTIEHLNVSQKPQKPDKSWIGDNFAKLLYPFCA